MKAVFLVLILSISFSSFAFTTPDKKQTPGALCTEQDPDFKEYRYAEHIAYCKRHVTHEEKLQIAAEYGGIPESEWHNYEFDHLIPLNAGGTSEIENIWPQPIEEAHEKDRLELEIYEKLSDGEITQAQAVKMVWNWFDQN